MIALLDKTINAAIESSVPKRKHVTVNKPLPNHLKILIQFRNIYRRNWKRYRDLSDHQQMILLNRRIIGEQFKLGNKNWNNTLSTLDKSSSTFWKITKILKRKHQNIPTLQDTKSYSTPEEKCNILAKYFDLNNNITKDLSDVETIRQVNSVVECINNAGTTTIDQNYFISFETTFNLIKKLKNKKAPGLDGITNQCLKKMPIIGINYIKNIFNSCLKLSYFPTQWKKSKTIAIPKPNKPPDSPKSYRPISLLPSLSKVFEKI